MLNKLVCLSVLFVTAAVYADKVFPASTTFSCEIISDGPISCPLPEGRPMTFQITKSDPSSVWIVCDPGKPVFYMPENWTEADNARLEASHGFITSLAVGDIPGGGIGVSMLIEARAGGKDLGAFSFHELNDERPFRMTGMFNNYESPVEGGADLSHWALCKVRARY